MHRADRPTRLVVHAALLAGVSLRTMYYWIAEGRVETKQCNGVTRVYIDRPWPEKRRRDGPRLEVVLRA